MTIPLDCGFFNGKRISFLRIDPALERGAKRNSHGTGDAAAPGRKVSELALTTDDTQPMRLSFLALLAERDPAVQARLERRRTLALEDELEDDEDRPTDPMIVVGR